MRTLFLFALVLAGCQKPNASSLDTPMPDSLMERFETPVASDLVAIPDGSEWTDVSLRDGYHAQLGARLYDAMYFGGDTWLARAEGVRRFRDSLIVHDTLAPSFWVEQLAASHLIGYAAVGGELATDSLWGEPELSVLGEEVDVLINHRNPQAMLIAAGLERLTGYWPEERIAAAAREAILSSQRWEASAANNTMMRLYPHADQVRNRGLERLQALAAGGNHPIPIKIGISPPRIKYGAGSR